MTVFLTEFCNPKKKCWKKRFIPKEKDVFSRHDFVHKVFCRQFFCGVICLFIPKSGRWLEEEQWLLYRFPVSHLRVMWSISRAFFEMFKSGILFWFCTFCVNIQWTIACLPTWLHLDTFALKQTCWGFGGFKFGCACVFLVRYTYDTWNLIPFLSPICHVMTEPCGAHGLRGPKDAEVQVVYSLHRSTFGNQRLGGWLGDFFGWAGRCYRSRMTWVLGRNEMSTRFWIPPNGLKVGQAPQMGVLTILDNPHMFILCLWSV